MMTMAPETLIPLPVVHQKRRFDCGAAVLQAVCRYYGVGPEDDDEFLRMCRTDPENGTDPEDIVLACRRLGLSAEPHEGMMINCLKQQLGAGRPVICAIQAWGEERAYGEHEWGHFVVAIGYDDRRILFQDPGLRDDVRGHLGYEEFERRWHSLGRNKQMLCRYGIVVWSDRVPDAISGVHASTRID